MCVGCGCFTCCGRPKNRPKAETCNFAVPLEYIPFLSEKDGRGIARIGNQTLLIPITLLISRPFRYVKNFSGEGLRPLIIGGIYTVHTK